MDEAPDARAATVVSVGYEGRKVGEMINELARQGVTVLVDTRQRASSRRAGFGKTALAHAAAAAGIEYRHERDLGNPRDNREPLRRGSPEARRTYLAHLEQHPDAYERTLQLVRRHTAALLCFERRHETCHRSCIIERLAADEPGLQVVRI